MKRFIVPLIVALVAGIILELLSLEFLTLFPLVKNIDPMQAANQLQQLQALQLDVLIHPLRYIHNEAFLKFQPIVLVVMLIVFIKPFMTKKNKAIEASDYGAYGTARWANKREVFAKEHYTDNLSDEGVLLLLSHKKPVILHDDTKLNRHVAVFGPSGSAKTQSYIFPNILNTKNKSIIAVDVKGELFERTSRIKKEQGFEVHVLNFVNMNISDRHNPLNYFVKDQNAQKIAYTLVYNKKRGNKDWTFWDDACVDLLSSIILYVKYELPKVEQHLGSVRNILVQIGKSREDMDSFFMSLRRGHPARTAYENINLIGEDAEEMRASVFYSASVVLDYWKYEEIAEFMAASDFNIGDIARKKMIVYLILPVADSTFAPLVSLFFDQVFKEFYKIADENFNKLPVPVRFLMDEFSNIGRIPEFSEILSTSRSYNIEISIVIQNITQLQDRYGEKQAEEIIGNCDHKLFLGANDKTTAQYFSDILGLTTMQVQGESVSSGDRSNSESISQNYTGRSLENIDELMRKDSEYAYLLRAGQRPVKGKKAWQSKLFPNVLTEENMVSRYDYEAPERGEYKVFENETFEEIEEYEVNV